MPPERSPSVEPDPATWAALPPGLLALVEAERAAGNRVLAVESGFPAPPAGFCVLLEQPVRTRPAAPADGLIYRQWPNWKGYHGYTDARGHHFVLNPPMDTPSDGAPPHGETRAEPRPEPHRTTIPGLLERFRRSMNLDYEKWREGIGYDLEALAAMEPGEKKQAESLLLARDASDWRDVEALALLDTPACRRALRHAAKEGTAAIRMAVIRHAPHLLSPKDRVATLVAALATAAPFDGLDQAIGEATRHHPPPVMDALWRGLATREGGVAVHYAALLTYLHGRADTPFDFEQRPLFLTFNTEDPEQRRQAIANLKHRLGLPDRDRDETAP